jgi:hypothetical protein
VKRGFDPCSESESRPCSDSSTRELFLLYYVNERLKAVHRSQAHGKMGITVRNPGRKVYRGIIYDGNFKPIHEANHLVCMVEFGIHGGFKFLCLERVGSNPTTDTKHTLRVGRLHRGFEPQLASSILARGARKYRPRICGGIGIHAWFRPMCLKRREGSTPFGCTQTV